MTIQRKIQLQVFLWLSLLLSGGQLGAQDFGLAITNTPTTPVVNSTLTFNLVAQTNILVVHTLPASVSYLSSTQDFGSLTINGQVLTFRLDWLFTNETTRISFLTRPTGLGSFTTLRIVSCA